MSLEVHKDGLDDAIHKDVRERVKCCLQVGDICQGLDRMFPGI